MLPHVLHFTVQFLYLFVWGDLGIFTNSCHYLPRVAYHWKFKNRSWFCAFTYFYSFLSIYFITYSFIHIMLACVHMHVTTAVWHVEWEKNCNSQLRNCCEWLGSRRNPLASVVWSLTICTHVLHTLWGEDSFKGRWLEFYGRKTSVWTWEHLFVATDFIDEETELQIVLLDTSILF